MDSESSNGKVYSEVNYTTTVKSVYVIEMNYSYYIDGLTSLAHLHSFSASITDFETGELIKTSRLNNSLVDFPIKQAVGLLVREMNKYIKKLC